MHKFSLLMAKTGFQRQKVASPKAKVGKNKGGGGKRFQSLREKLGKHMEKTWKNMEKPKFCPPPQDAQKGSKGVAWFGFQALNTL